MGSENRRIGLASPTRIKSFIVLCSSSVGPKTRAVVSVRRIALALRARMVGA